MSKTLLNHYGMQDLKMDENNILNKIKKPADLLYEKQTNERTGGNDSKNLAISGDTHLITNIPQTTHDVKGEKDKL